jgi:hypothetical protein
MVFGPPVFRWLRKTLRTARFSTFSLLGLAALAAGTSCSRDAERETNAGAPRPPSRISLVKLMSWAEPSTSPCETDLQGHAPPARYTLKYAEDGRDPVVIETDADKLFRSGWSAINRSERGMGFEKSGDFTSIDFDIWEELQCACDADGTDAGKGWKLGVPVNVKILWKSKTAPVVTAMVLDDGKLTPVQGVTMNGQLATYEFRFVRRLPEGHTGECSSRFFIGLELSEPI